MPGHKIVMFPWFAFGHMTPFLHLANELAEKGNKIVVLLPKKAVKQLEHFNQHPDSITLHPLTIPAVDGLPPRAETASDIPIHLTSYLCIAMDRTRDQLEKVISETKSALVIYDLAYQVPEVAKANGIKSMQYAVVSASSRAEDRAITEEELALPPQGYPSSKIVLRAHEARSLMFISQPFGEDVTFFERSLISMKECDAIAIRTCSELEEQLCNYIGSQYNKPVFLTGPVLPEPPSVALEEKWANWLSGFEPGSVIYCAFGSQFILDKKQFQELCLGFESTGLPFLAALKPPTGSSTIEEALPEGFEERVKGRGMVWGGWVQQMHILNHPSIGCFVSHCGFGSMWESLLSNCQLVLVPHLGDQILNARLLADELKVAVEVEREADGWFSKENLCNAIKSVMDRQSEFASTLKANHAKWKETLSCPGFMANYMDNFIQNVEDLLKK
ncbi:LOW QUALITY PROTEIN: UDP-glycosyltransferase 79B6-like [Rutidosis leptorrhynchoides]|uniref:LOW QUALITY PROTEIN: UDP-glycosyltransferase 79B6-like n=1 Tax=Rutidosis leptorrhynchoides TaxID=125765 RepID=UPI003A993563